MKPPPFQKLPVGSVDSHMHLYASGPHREDAPFAVPEGGLAAYRAVMDRLGIDRVVLVQSMLYGADNSVMLAGLDGLGRAARGIAVTPADAPDALWNGLSEQGVVGLRAFMLQGGIYAWDDLPRLAARLADRNWQLHLQLDGRDLAGRAQMLAELPCVLVVDHVGKFLEPVSPDHPAFLALLDLVASGRVWVKLSGLYETSRTGGSDYEDVARLARRLAAEAPHRVVWASNWPHPNLQPAPDDCALVDLARRIVPGAAGQRMLFADNAAELFGFAEVAA
ncbi:amidohydrolase family protein [Tropicimonas sp.]|uniref:amidohydrolase family protein n=1 Tax=Tropicimonas sp. TaxID=2067044 RepID=UPI003A85E735